MTFRMCQIANLRIYLNLALLRLGAHLRLYSLIKEYMYSLNEVNCLISS